jgi:hypothetical protein
MDGRDLGLAWVHTQLVGDRKQRLSDLPELLHRLPHIEDVASQDAREVSVPPTFQATTMERRAPGFSVERSQDLACSLAGRHDSRWSRVGEEVAARFAVSARSLDLARAGCPAQAMIEIGASITPTSG